MYSNTLYEITRNVVKLIFRTVFMREYDFLSETLYFTFLNNAI